MEDTKRNGDFAQYLEHYKNGSCPTTDCKEWRLSHVTQGCWKVALPGTDGGSRCAINSPPQEQAPLWSSLRSSFLAASLAATPTQGASNTSFPWHFLASTNKNVGG